MRTVSQKERRKTNMEKRLSEEALEQAPNFRFVGVALPLPLHKELRMEAAKEGISASQLMKKSIFEYLKGKR
jgi:diphthamide biosynthesis methyltransferase